MIGDGRRGGILESLLAKIVDLDCSVLGMSATVGNMDELSQFLKAKIFEVCVARMCVRCVCVCVVVASRVRAHVHCKHPHVNSPPSM